jgi:hypothetical protein
MIVAAAALACSTKSSQITIENKSNSKLVNVNVAVGGKQLRISQIAARSNEILRFDPVADSGLQITYDVEGGLPVQCEGDLYVTTAVSSDIVVTIDKNGVCRVWDGKGAD